MIQNVIKSPNAINTSEQQSLSDKDKLKKACKDFESIFTGQLFKSMRQAGFKSDFVKKSMGEEVFTEMLDTEMAKVTAENSVGGLADSMYKQLEQLLPENLQKVQGNNFPGKKDQGSIINPYNTLKNKDNSKPDTGIDIAS